MAPKQSFRKKEPYRHNPNYKIKYPGKGAYHFPSGPTHISPCIDIRFRGEQNVIGNNLQHRKTM
jgi:hypothetical protein